MVDYVCPDCEWREDDVAFTTFWYYCCECGAQVECHVDASDLSPHDTLSDKV